MNLYLGDQMPEEAFMDMDEDEVAIFRDAYYQRPALPCEPRATPPLTRALCLLVILILSACCLVGMVVVAGRVVRAIAG